MNYGTTEQELVNRLTAFIAERGETSFYEAALMPESEHQFLEFYSGWTKARVAIQYMDSDFEPGKALGIIVQEEKVRFRTTFETRKLRGEGGLYNLMEITKLALIGFRPSDCERLSVANYGLLEFEQGAWQPYLEFECRAMNVQLHDDYSGPVLGDGIQSVTGIIDFDSFVPQFFSEEFNPHQFQ